MLPVFYNCRTTLNLNPGHIWISKWFSQIRIPLFRNESGILYLLYAEEMELFQTTEERRIHVKGFAPNWPEPRRECWNAGLRLAEPAVRREYWPPALRACARREKWALGYWNVGLMVKFVILPEFSGYCEKIRISPPSILTIS